ncbi:MAG TPA: polyprenol phosphomannose-dependent alpha 1,6 mannosyltransferase MptB [Actinomycetota bacterium]|nr:polyprenol phosphomannose-dependent alpha 1,6 mannosyltransferase MptB [Actinomycetota bacterium]
MVATVVGLVLTAVSVLDARSPWLVSAPRIALAASPLHRVIGSPGSPLPPPLLAAAALAGCAALGAGFVASLRLARRGQLRLRTVVLLAGLANLTLALLPPISSADVFSYLFQGRLYAQGLNPYLVTADDLRSDPVAQLVDPMWRSTPSPYGPLFLLVAAFISHLESIAQQVLVMKLLAATAVLAAMALTVRTVGRMDPPSVPYAASLVGLNPLVVLSVVGAGRNDSFVVLAIATAAALATARSREPGRQALCLASIVAGGLVKLPGMVLAIPASARRSGGTNERSARQAVRVWTPAVLLVAVTIYPFLPELGRSLRRVAIFANYWNFLSPAALPLAITTRLGLGQPSSALGVLISAYTYSLMVASLLVLALATERARRDPDAMPLADLRSWSEVLFLIALSLPSFSHWYLAWLTPLAWTAPRSVRRPLVIGSMLGPFLDAIARPSRYVLLYVGLRDAALLTLVPYLLFAWISCFRGAVAQRSAATPTTTHFDRSDHLVHDDRHPGGADRGQ